jgi:WD40 repeat protein
MTFCINPHCPQPQNYGNILFCQSCSSELLLEGRYQVISLLGSGRFSRTYEVVERDGTNKVLKILTHNHPEAVSLFRQEAQVLSQLDYPGIPKVNEYFTFLPNNVNEPLHCLVMEKIEGLNLEQYLIQRQHRPINQGLALEWLNQLFNILHQIHSHNFFHRDIKPSNILLKGNGQLVLIEFGAVREVISNSMLQQVAGQITGIKSPDFTAPEQLNGQGVLTSDFFAMGRTFVFLLTNKLPNDADIHDPNSDELRWRNFAPDISPPLANLIDDLMQPIPSQRPQSTQEVLLRLELIQREFGKTTATSRRTKITSGRGFRGFRFPNIYPRMMGIVGVIAAVAVILITIPYFFSSVSILLPLPAEKWAKNLVLANTIRGHSEAVSSVAITPNAQTIASASHDQTIKLWNSQTGKLIRTLYGHTLPVLSVAISPDGQQLVSGSLDETIKQWNLNNGEKTRSLKTDGYIAWNNAIAISKDGQILATGSTDKTIRLWNFTTGNRLRTLYGHSLPILALAISPNGQTLASGSTDKTIRLWNLANGQQTQIFSGHTGWITCLGITPDNQTIVSSSLDKTIKLWSANTGKLIQTLSGHSYSVLSLAISPDGKIIASGGIDGEIRLWNLGTGKLIHTISAHSKQVASLAISQDGTTMISGSADETINVWRSQ